MTTIADALQNAADALNNAVTNVLALESQLQTAASQAQTNATTVINNYNNRPAFTNVFCDPINGLDSNDGASPTTPKKSLDTILANVGNNNTAILLLNDALISQRSSVYANLIFYGVQLSANQQGFIYFNRTISFLGTATNSPQPVIGTFCSGVWLAGVTLSTHYINFSLPDQPPGQNYRAHFSSSAGTSASFDTPTLNVSSSAAGALFGASGNRSNVYAAFFFGSNAVGHVFDGVAAGGNPNSLWQYSSNITSA